MAKKSDVLKQKGIKLRKVTEKDRKAAKTDYQRGANFVITTSNGDEFYSKNGSLKECLWAEGVSKENAKPKATKAPSKPKTTTKKATTKKTTAKPKSTTKKTTAKPKVTPKKMTARLTVKPIKKEPVKPKATVKGKAKKKK